MRKFILHLLVVFFAFGFVCFSPINTTARATTEYRRVITHDTPFYSDANGTNALFYLPYTYYVKVLEVGQILSHVECYGTGETIALDGYVPTTMLFEDNLPVIKPYMEKEIVTLSTTVLYFDKELTSPIQYVFASRNLVFYGQAQNQAGQIVFYVGYNNRLGYVAETNVSPFEFTTHPNELTFLQPEPTPEPEPETPKNDSSLMTVRTVIVICLFFAGMIALFVAIKNKPKDNVTTFYDENEYE